MPSEKDMHAEVKADIALRKAKGLRDSDRHRVKVNMMREYFKTLENDAGLESTPSVMFDLLEEVAKERQRNPLGYKLINYRLFDNDLFKIV